MSVKHTTDKFVSVDRYYISGLHPHIWKHPEGEMVYFDDYVDLWAEKERLKAEVERLTAMADENTHLHKGIYSLSLNVVQLKDEVERLRKAGDAMERSLAFTYPDSPKIKDWNAAKEGKPSV